MIGRMAPLRPYISEAWDNRLSEKARRLNHTHGGNELQLVRDPGTVVVRNGIEHPAPPGTLFLHREGEEHGFVSDGAPTRFMVINYDPDEGFEAALPALRAAAPRVWHLDDHQMAGYVDIFTRLQVELDGRRTGRDLAASALVRLLLVMIARFDEHEASAGVAGGGVDPEVHRLRRAIDLRRQGSASGALETMVDNYDALRHRFRRTYGESPSRMLGRLRIDKAKGMLSGSDMTMAEIAEHVGYARQHEFSRAFHRAVGCTPSAYRRQSKHG